MEQAVNIQDIPIVELIRSAQEARKKAYVPYSGYAVGAAVLTRELRIYTGCNIENASYTPTICAERCAISKAVSEGSRKLKAVAVVGGPKEEKRHAVCVSLWCLQAGYAGIFGSGRVFGDYSQG